MSTPLSTAQRALRDATLGIFGPQFGIGGDQWTRRRGTENLIVSGYVRQVRLAQDTLIGEGPIRVGFMFTSTLDQDVQPGDLLISVAEPLLVFGVGEPYRRAGYRALFVADLGTDRFPARLTIEHGTATQDSHGEEHIVYSPDPLLVSIAALVREHTGDQERRRPDETIITQTFDVLLNGSYPTITETDQLVLTWPRLERHNILSVAHDPNGTYTTLETEIVGG